MNSVSVPTYSGHDLELALLQRRLVDLAVADRLDAGVEAGGVEHLRVDVGQGLVLGEVGRADDDLPGAAAQRRRPGPRPRRSPSRRSARSCGRCRSLVQRDQLRRCQRRRHLVERVEQRLGRRLRVDRRDDVVDGLQLLVVGEGDQLVAGHASQAWPPAAAAAGLRRRGLGAGLAAGAAAGEREGEQEQPGGAERAQGAMTHGARLLCPAPAGPGARVWRAAVRTRACRHYPSTGV